MTKNKTVLFGVLILLIVNLSCSNDDSGNGIDPIDNFKIENYHGLYALYTTQLSLNTEQDNLVKFRYDEQDRITKRIGNILFTSIDTGFLHDSLYTDLTYLDNKIHLVKRISPFGGITSVPENETTIELDDNQKMAQKITFELYNDPQIDTTNFTYANGKLTSYLKTSNSDGPAFDLRHFEESNLYYTNENLDSIVTISSRKFSDTPYTILEGIETKIFSGYDTAQNPFRKLQIFNETFNRSLSQNNFTEYRITSNSYSYPDNDYNQIPIVSPTIEVSVQTWSFAHNENGEWIYNQF